MDDSSDRIAFRDVVIVGGGCYGTFYAGQLERARAMGKVAYRRLLIVDRDAGCQVLRELGEDSTRRLVVQEWGDFFDRYFASVLLPAPGAPSDAIVPSPLMPHLMYQWLVRRARLRWPERSIDTRPMTVGPGTPYDVSAADGTRYVSFADWICPTHCIEPALCPARFSMASAISQVRGARITGQRAGSMQWVGQIQSAKETYRVPSGALTSYGVPGPKVRGRVSMARSGQRWRARRTSHWYMRWGISGEGTIASVGAPGAGSNTLAR